MTDMLTLTADPAVLILVGWVLALCALLGVQEFLHGRRHARARAAAAHWRNELRTERHAHLQTLHRLGMADDTVPLHTVEVLPKRIPGVALAAKLPFPRRQRGAA